jgi:alkane 1-monooxygenase
MFYCYNYFNIFSAPLFCLLALGKGPLFAVLAFVLAFVIHPTADWISNKFFREFTLKINGESKKRWAYDVPLYLAVPFQIVLVISAFSVASTNLTEAICAGALCGLSGGILGIASSHELIHRTKRWQRSYGMLMLYTINYPHFAIEHMFHHMTVATAEDPDTAERDESVYSFMVRSIPAGWMKCWKWKKKMLNTTLLQVVVIAALFTFGGKEIGVIYMVQGIVTILLLKWINYVEHYGLKRKVIDGRLEPVGDKHSWDSTTAMTNFSLFNLGFHTQHHIKPSVHYHQLPKVKDTWNELPNGYSAMMMLALIPASWRKTMNRQLDLIDV